MDKDIVADARATLARESLALNTRNAAGLNLPPLILMTDDQRAADYAEAVHALPPGSAVIVRHRDAPELERLFAMLRDIARPRGVRCLIAGDVDRAERLDTDGIHASEANLTCIMQWRARHARWLITGAIHNAQAAVQADGANALLLSPVFATKSHPGTLALGVDAFRAMAARVSAPVYALGGITAENAKHLRGTRAAGIALIGGWLRS
jgi:thiamine-phosphate pyrophosphorylase